MPPDFAFSPINPANEELEAGLDRAILKFALCRLSPDLGCSYLGLALRRARRVLVLEYTLAERNIALPAHWAARIFSDARDDFWRAGAFWGIAGRCGAQPVSDRAILCGAATLAIFESADAACLKGAMAPFAPHALF